MVPLQEHNHTINFVFDSEEIATAMKRGISSLRRKLPKFLGGQVDDISSFLTPLAVFLMKCVTTQCWGFYFHSGTSIYGVKMAIILIGRFDRFPMTVCWIACILWHIYPTREVDHITVENTIRPLALSVAVANDTDW